MTVQSPDLISELLRGMRLSGVKYRRIQASAPFGVAFHQAPGRAQFHFVSHGSALLRMESGTTFELSSGDALFIPAGNSHALLSDEQATITPINAFPSEPICSLSISRNLYVLTVLLLSSISSPMALLLSGQDYTAKSFLLHVSQDEYWQGCLSVAELSRYDFPAADHTFSTPGAWQAVTDTVLTWMAKEIP